MNTKKRSEDFYSASNIQPDFIPFSFIHERYGMDSNFIKYLAKYFHANELETAVAQYHLRGTKKGKTIFLQIDHEGFCRTAKIIDYDKAGHRKKTNGAMRWTGFMPGT